MFEDGIMDAIEDSIYGKIYWLFNFHALIFFQRTKITYMYIIHFLFIIISEGCIIKEATTSTRI